MGVQVVKLGSSIVADEAGSLREQELANACDAVAALHASGESPVIVTSGAIARGVKLLELPLRPRAMDELQAASAVGQGGLYRNYEALLSERGLRSAQVLLTFFDMSARTHYLNARRTLAKLLEWRVVPVINENDTTTTDEISFGDNDFLAAQVAILTGAERLVLLTDQEGLFTADPREDSSATLVSEVSDPQELDSYRIGHQTSPLGSGGMRSKSVAAEMATAAGVETVICSGLDAMALPRALAGEAVGTRFCAQAARHSSFKLWLRYAKQSRGRLLIDGGAAKALRRDGTSLLPVGVLAVIGEFDAGDAVEILEAPGGDGEDPAALEAVARPLAKGIANYAADELRRLCGKNSAELRKLVPEGAEEAVHRDYLVLVG